MTGEEAGEHHLVAVRLDAVSLAAPTPAAERERGVAIHDLLLANAFRPADSDHGPYELDLGLEDGRLRLAVSRPDGAPLRAHSLSLRPLKRAIRDYFLVCESYDAAVREGSVSQIEAIDMGRRALHDEAADILRDRLAGRVEIDGRTARRLFTLICALHRRVGLT